MIGLKSYKEYDNMIFFYFAQTLCNFEYWLSMITLSIGMGIHEMIEILEEM